MPRQLADSRVPLLRRVSGNGGCERKDKWEIAAFHEVLRGNNASPERKPIPRPA